MLPFQLSKWAKGCDGTSEADIMRTLEGLVRADYVYFDDDTEETFIRSYIRNDGILKQPNIVKNALRCAEAVESGFLRAAQALELRRLGRVDADTSADRLDPNGTAAESFAKAKRSLEEGFPNPSETLPEPSPEIERVSEPLSNPAGKGKGKGKGESLVPEYSLFKDEKKQNAPALPDAPKLPEQIATTSAYERVGKAFKFVAVLQIAKWAIHDRGIDPATVENAIVSVYEMGKPITRQTIGQYLDGHINRDGRSTKAATGGLTARELNIAQAERFKSNPNMELLRAAGLEPANSMRALPGGQ
jgi:hypothetical protein